MKKICAYRKIGVRIKRRDVLDVKARDADKHLVTAASLTLFRSHSFRWFACQAGVYSGNASLFKIHHEFIVRGAPKAEKRTSGLGPQTIFYSNRNYYGKDGVVLDADQNAAVNIAKRSKLPASYLTVLDGQASVSRPIVCQSLPPATSYKPPTLVGGS